MTSTQGDGWIKMSERKPTTNHFPIWFWNNDCTFPHYHGFRPEEGDGHYTHWKPAVFPAPPAKELTQYDRDEHQRCITHGLDPDDGHANWHAALAFERRQKAEWDKAVKEAFDNLLRRRCGLDT